MRRLVVIAVLILFTLVSVETTRTAGAEQSQRGSEEDPFGEKKDESDKFKFVRIKNAPLYAGDYLGDGGAHFSHDYPEAGLHLSKILSELSKLSVVQEENEFIFAFDDPNLFKYPFAYMCEVGYMELNDKEIAGMREYLLRGGFLLVDDFRSDREMSTFTYYLKKALPEFEMKPLDVSHPIFNCFFSIKSLDLRPIYRSRYGGGATPQFL